MFMAKVIQHTNKQTLKSEVYGKGFPFRAPRKGGGGAGQSLILLKGTNIKQNNANKNNNFSYEISWRALKVKVSEINITIEQHT